MHQRHMGGPPDARRLISNPDMSLVVAEALMGPPGANGGPDGTIPDRLHDDNPLTADPRDHGWPVFVIMPPAGLALLAAMKRSAS
jgi:hypothetical protein